MKIAQFKIISVNHVTVMSEEAAQYMAGYVRVSEWVSVEFKPLTMPDVAPQIEYLERVKQKEEEEFAVKKSKHEKDLRMISISQKELMEQAMALQGKEQP